MILAFVSRKGGVGKTTSVVNLAGALVQLGHKVLVVDLDSQGSASRALGVERAELAPSIHDVLFRGRPLGEVVRRTSVDRLELVTASADLLGVDLDVQNHRRRDHLLADALRPHVERWDWILLDCPPSLTAIVRNALVAADGWIVPTPPHFLAFEGIDVLIDSATRLLQRFERGDELAGILLTMVDYRTASARAHVAELRLRHGLRVLDSEIPVNVRLTESPLGGQTIFESDPKASGAQAYRMLAVELLHRLRPGETIHRPKSSGAAGGVDEPVAPALPAEPLRPAPGDSDKPAN
ncbi:MAG: ParA family protein [Thermoanaerobaculia bacterium]|nr:ParA family protein [Thermoanaerobaculia bacterium]